MRALVINTAFLGDVVFTLPLVENLGRAGYTVDVLGRPGYAALAEGLTGFGAALSYDKRGKDAGPAAFWGLGRALARRGYRVVLGAHPSTRSGMLAALIGAPESLGWGPVGYRRRVRRGPRFVEDALALGEALGIDCPVRRPALAGSEPRVRPSSAPIALIPGARWATKRWPARHWSELAARLRPAGQRIIWVGGAEDADHVTADAEDEQLFGAPLPETAHRLAGCRAAIGGDSGLVWLAQAAGVPAVVLFGPTDARRHPVDPARVDLAVSGLACRPCSPHGPPTCPRRHHRCLRDLGVDAALDGLQLLADRR